MREKVSTRYADYRQLGHGVKMDYQNEFLTEDIDAIKQLIKEGLDVNAKGHYLPTGGGSETTFLHVAATYNLPKVGRLLIEKGADINARDSQGCTPLHRAADESSCKTAKILIEAGADLNAQMSSGWGGGTPLHSALRWKIGDCGGHSTTSKCWSQRRSTRRKSGNATPPCGMDIA